MHELVTKPLWSAHVSPPNFPSFSNTSVESTRQAFDVAVIGGGITGLTCAWLLKKQGKKVALLEAHRIGSGTTGLTSAHISTAYDHGYHTLEKSYSEHVARCMANAMREGLETIESIVEELDIACDFERVPGYHFCDVGQDRSAVDSEFSAAKRAGLDVSYTSSVPLPFPVTLAYRVENQAQFHPLKYLYALAKAVHGDGSAVFEHSRVTAIDDGEPCAVRTDAGTIVVDDVIMATHTPLGFSLIQAEVPPFRSFVTAFRVLAPLASGLFWDEADPYHYIRSYTSDAGSFLVVGGYDFKTAHGDEEKSFAALAAYAKEKFDAHDLIFKWAGQFYDPIDHLPYIGLKPGTRHSYLATGFSGDGLSLGAFSAKLISQEIAERPSVYRDIFQPSRFPTHNISGFLQENADVARCFIGDRVEALTRSNKDELEDGEGRVIMQGMSSIAEYRNEAGELRRFSAVCPHMKCLVRWNQVEKSFDCPCHGSRFDTHGNLLEGPALSGLEAIEDDNTSEIIRNPINPSVNIPPPLPL